MFNFGNKNDLNKDLAKLLKEEGDFVQELSDVSAKGAEFHARLESIEKALRTNPDAYNSKEADKMVEKAKEKYNSELEKRMKDQASDQLRPF